MGPVQYTFKDAVAVVRIDNPPVNALSSQVRAALQVCIERVAADPNVRGMVLTGSERAFSSGADIRQFGTHHYWAFPRTKDLADQLEQLNKPVVAAISGFAMGGGLELALGAHYRVAATECRLGLPEVQLGLIPAAGGILRLPRLIPFPDAIRMMMEGATVTAETARKLGLLDELTQGDVIEAALRLLNRGGEFALPVRRSKQQLLRDYDAGLVRKIRQEGGPALARNRAINALLSCIQGAAAGPEEEALSLIEKCSAELVESVESKALRHVFLGKRTASKTTSLKGVSPRRIQTVALRATGQHGKELAQRLRRSGRLVYFTDMANYVDCAQGSPSSDTAIDLALYLDSSVDASVIQSWAADFKDITVIAGSDVEGLRAALDDKCGAEFANLYFRFGADSGLMEFVTDPGSSKEVTAGLIRVATDIGLVSIVEKQGPVGLRMWACLEESVQELVSEGVPSTTASQIKRRASLYAELQQNRPSPRLSKTASLLAFSNL